MLNKNLIYKRKTDSKVYVVDLDSEGQDVVELTGAMGEVFIYLHEGKNLEEIPQLLVSAFDIEIDQAKNDVEIIRQEFIKFGFMAK